MGKIDDLKNFIELNSIDIILIQETHLRPGSRSPKINNYNFYRTDKIFNDTIRRDMYPGGTAIFIKKHIPHHHIPTPDLSTTQATIIQLHTKTPITIISTYVPPQRNSVTDPNRNFFPTNDFHLLHNRFNNYFLGGDLNSHHRKWNCSRANSFGTPCESVSALTSDHNPVIYHFDLTIPNIDSHNYKIPNWFKFTQHLSTAIYTPHDLNTISGIEDSIKLLTDIVYTCHDSTSKHISKQHKISHFTDDIKTKIQERNRLRKIWQASRHPQDKQNYYDLNTLIQQEIKINKNTSWNNHLNSLSTHDNSLWKTIKSLKKHEHIIPPLNYNNNIVYTNIDKANTLAAQYQKQFSPNNIRHTPTEQLVENVLNSYINRQIQADAANSTINILPSEIVTFIKNLKNNKAPGFDNITNTIRSSPIPNANSPHLFLDYNNSPPTTSIPPVQPFSKPRQYFLLIYSILHPHPTCSTIASYSTSRTLLTITPELYSSSTS
ncbi:putative RNA-directed DNA polymerase from transposon X-element [Caerostris extrusa]|uniref:RNA-directed DNA polymerase from transposon X-element n=1 Tax=Caerostris extrusa TaxID=172846 RepID=A0AAV4XV81_CAEEX|nr:putative RNA-directed DNA polymerase from transposon X-element [Caerostris extrusa]